MSSELPAASGRSVFSVFGFGSSHYGDEDFNSPLETAPESFDASNSLTALRKKKKQQAIFHEDVLEPFSPETAHKIRVGLPDQSELVLQSFCQPNKKPATLQPHPHHGVVRRYSTAQEESDDALHGTGVLTKFNNTLTQTTCMLTRAGGSSANIYSSINKDSGASTQTTSSSGVSIPAMTRVKSSPHLPVVPNYLGSPKKESLLGSEIISQYLRRNQSQGDLLEVAECQTGDKSDSHASDSVDNKAVVLSSSIPGHLKSETPKFHDYNPPETYSPPSSGFSILSKTRKFGAWLTKATDGEKVEVTKKDLNVLAPNSF